MEKSEIHKLFHIHHDKIKCPLPYLCGLVQDSMSLKGVTKGPQEVTLQLLHAVLLSGYLYS